MYRMHLRTLIRRVARRPLYPILSIFVLALGMSCFCLTGAFVSFEMSYDSYHKRADRIYRVIHEISIPARNTEAVVAVTPYPLADAMISDFPGVVNAVRLLALRDRKSMIRRGKKEFRESGIICAEQSLFEIFDFYFLKGTPENALTNPRSVVLTQEMASKYFFEIDPLGETLTIDGEFYKVTGVISHIPPNSHFHFNFLISLNVEALTGAKSRSNWLNHSYYTYILLDAGLSPEGLSRQLPAFIIRHAAHQMDAAGMILKSKLQALTDIHLYSDYLYELESNGDILYVYLCGGIGLLSLIIACINFLNLTVSGSLYRSAEIGMRKVLGAQRHQLMFQLLGESLLQSCAAMFIAISILGVLSPVLLEMIGVAFDIKNNWSWIDVASVAVVVGIVGGIYPSWYLSGFNPIDTLKQIGTVRSVNTWLRNALVINQFGITIFLVGAALVVHEQLTYIGTKPLGFEKDSVMVVNLSKETKSKWKAIKNKLSEMPGVLGVCATSSVPSKIVPQWPIRKSGNADIMSAYTLFVDYDFIQVLGLSLKEGRGFSDHFLSDHHAVLINEVAAQQMGIINVGNENLKNEVELLDVGSEVIVKERVPVIGVVKNFHFGTLYDKIAPLVIRLAPHYHHYNFIAIKLNPEKIQDVLEVLKIDRHNFFDSSGIEYSFLDDVLDASYKKEKTLGWILYVLAAFSIIMACLGLFGLVNFNTKRRAREIGIRKVFGASWVNIVALFWKEVTILVLTASVLASLLVYSLMKKWLEVFAYRIDFGVEVYLAMTAFGLGFAWLTISYQVIKISLSNPVDALRYE